MVFYEFGFAAEANFLEMMLENEHQNWYFFRRSKMALYDLKVPYFCEKMFSCVQNIFKITNLIMLCNIRIGLYKYLFIFILKSEDQKILIEDEYGNTMTALTLFSASLIYLKQSLLDDVNERVIISMGVSNWL